jgi:hypothetical protein
MTENEATQVAPPAAEVKPVETEQPEAPSTPPEKKSIPWVPIGLGVLLTASLGAAGFFAYQNFQLKNKMGMKKDVATPPPMVTQVPSPMATEVPLPTATPDPYAGWLTHTGSCYTFKYPNNVTFTERQEENLVHLSLWGPTQKPDTEFFDGISLTVSLPLDLGGLTLSDYVDNQLTEDQQHSEITSPKQPTTVNGISGFTYTNEGLGTFQNIFLQSPGQTCSVEIVNSTKDPGNQGYQQTVNKILSSFQFTN